MKWQERSSLSFMHFEPPADTVPAADDQNRLLLEFCGETYAAVPGAELTFGRCADVEIDDNPYLHRVVGRFECRDGTWWLHHLGRTTVLQVRDLDGPSSATLAPDRSLALAWGRFAVGFGAGQASYELEGTLGYHEWYRDVLGEPGAAPVTLDWGRVELNADQRLLLVAMSEARLLRPSDPDASVPPNRAGAARLGWSTHKYNRKLDHLCEKLARAGVRGLRGDIAQLAADRRRRLVDHAIAVGLVGVEDLQLLDGLPRAAA
jgi:hypothetical protein